MLISAGRAEVHWVEVEFPFGKRTSHLFAVVSRSLHISGSNSVPIHWVKVLKEGVRTC